MGEATSTNLHLHYGAILNVQIQEATIHPTIIHYHQSGRFSFQDSVVASRQAIYAFLATALINFLQLHYQGKSESPFETRPLTMLLAIVSLFIYCLSYDAKLRLFSNTRKNSTSIFDHCMEIFGPLSLVALASVLFPTISCLFLFPAALFYSLCQIFPLVSGIRTAGNWLLAAMKNRFSDDRELRQRSTRRLVSNRISVEIPLISLSRNAMRNNDTGIRPPV